jgi:hypothetical protein
MMHKARITLLAILFLLPAIVFAQKDSISQRKQISSQLVAEKIRTMGVSNDMLDKLKRSGIDVVGQLSTGNILDPSVEAVIRDLVIIGRVEKIVDVPAKKSEPFHSKIVVRIIELLKGPKPNGENIELVREDGPIINDRDSVISYLRVPNELTFVEGEIAVFFFTEMAKDTYLNARYKSYFRTNRPGPQSPTYWVNHGCKYSINDSLVYYRGNRIPLKRFTEDIKIVARLLTNDTSN